MTAEGISTQKICLICLARKITRNWVAGSISKTSSSVRATVTGRGLDVVVIELTATETPITVENATGLFFFELVIKLNHFGSSFFCNDQSPGKQFR